MTGLTQPWRVALAALILVSGPSAADEKKDAGPQAPASSSERAEKGDATYRQLETFARVLSYVENNYVEPPNQERLIYGAIQGMLDTLDPHTVFMPPEVFREMKIDTSGEWGGLGIEIARKNDRIIVVAPIDDTPAARAGLKAGDELVGIDGESTRGMDVGRAMQKMRGPAGGRVLLSILRQGFSAPREIAIIRDHIRIISVEGELYGGIGHVKVKNFQERTDQYLRKELDRLRGLNGGKELRGLVLDLRNNPGGLLDEAVAMSDRFLPGNLPIVFTRGRDGRNSTEERSKDRDTEKNYPVVVLVNGGSASASEIVAGALQDHGRATLMGSPTFGKGSVQTVIELEDGSGLKLTIARYYTPKGRSIQERGITPDYVVPDEPGAKPGREAPREKDLQRHFRAESSATSEPASPAPRGPPENLPKWETTAALKDYPLKVALEYLHGLSAAPGRPPARAEGR
ncbi:carboxyl-terminal protease family protein [Myxococcus stipitatus DSM 14675]|uniref:Carboxyl-terminal protease family protein n=1 Tax=Myxococcus stipitatus (strain DSM 14675 / JCM 12634 / Mx s8) TaxID=1278073 RepID=L7UHV2_MYXSD|nr:S41 family peptidase [Myxococcus stipitatus]AGC47603.1 carboxyl-terminal protease family protein [Myxococcus stipitatus DSM 14675]